MRRWLRDLRWILTAKAINAAAGVVTRTGLLYSSRCCRMTLRALAWVITNEPQRAVVMPAPSHPACRCAFVPTNGVEIPVITVPPPPGVQ